VRRGAVVALVVVVLWLGAAQRASAHAGFVASDPAVGARLDVAPTAVRISFSEKPEPGLAQIHVVDAGGSEHQTGAPLPPPDDPLTLAVPVQPLDIGVYTVAFRVVSSVDGHATDGSFVFGVGVSPTAAQLAAAQPESTRVSWVEVVARWVFLVAVVALLGATLSSAAGFAGTGAGRMASGAWAASIAGLVMLAEAQRRAAGTSFGDLAETAVGRALWWRAAALAAAGAILLATSRATGRARQTGWWLASGATAIAIVIHVGAGHAAGDESAFIEVAAQVAHFVAAAVWIGGLAALLLGTRGVSSREKSAAVRRFSAVAVVMLVIVTFTGVIRGVDEVSTWNELRSTGYGRAIVAKSLLLVAIAGFAAVNRWRNVRVVDKDLRPLRRAGRAEVLGGALALLAAAILGSLAPPAAGQRLARPGIDVSGADFATSIRVRLEATTAQPGPNRFRVHVADFDSGEPLTSAQITLEFTPLDDPGIAPTTLALDADPDGSFTGSGANLAFDGRWRVSVRIQHGAEGTVVPLDVLARSAPQFVSIQRVPGQPVIYAAQVSASRSIELWADPTRVGTSRLFATIRDAAFGDEIPVDQAVITIAHESGRAEQRVVERLGPGEFVAAVTLPRGKVTAAVIARSADGVRMRGEVVMDIP
jgi:copper transport protein